MKRCSINMLLMFIPKHHSQLRVFSHLSWWKVFIQAWGHFRPEFGRFGLSVKAEIKLGWKQSWEATPFENVGTLLPCPHTGIWITWFVDCVTLTLTFIHVIVMTLPWWCEFTALWPALLGTFSNDKCFRFEAGRTVFYYSIKVIKENHHVSHDSSFLRHDLDCIFEKMPWVISIWLKHSTTWHSRLLTRVLSTVSCHCINIGEDRSGQINSNLPKIQLVKRQKETDTE